MSTGEPDNCICGRTIHGSGVCPVHKIESDIANNCLCYITDYSGRSICRIPCPVHTQELDMPTVDNIRNFISPEQEAELRVTYRNHFKEFGFQGLFICMGEMLASVKILNEVMVDITDEEKKKE